MGKVNAALLAFNRGLISPLALARTDLARTALSAAVQSNWMPRTLGSMMLRPGLGRVGPTLFNLTAKHLKFIFSSVTDQALVEVTASGVRIKVDEAPIVRPFVSTAFVNPGFDADLSGWTDADDTGTDSGWLTGGFMYLKGTGYNSARRRQALTIAAAYIGVEHGIRLKISRGRVTLKVGTTPGGDDIISAPTLRPGVHSLAFTPAVGTVYVELSSTTPYMSLVDRIGIEANDFLIVDSPWMGGDLSLLRYTQSGDVLFISCKGYQPRRIERRAKRSWSCVIDEVDDGPFRSQNLTQTTLTPSGLSGDITLTASTPIFRPGHVGALFRMTSQGQTISSALSGENQYSDPIRISGVGAQRSFHRVVAGSFSGFLSFQRSVATPDNWSDIGTSNVSGATGSDDFNDGLDNQIIYYRYGFKAGNYTSGTCNVTLTFTGGGISGVVRVTDYTSQTSVKALVLVTLGSTQGTVNWSEGAWSDYRGWPSAVALHEGRLWEAGKGNVNGSISDAYNSRDDKSVGDAGPIDRSIGEGPVDSINWLLPLQRLVIGGEGAEYTARSSSFDEPLTPTNFNLRSPSTQGSSAVAPVKVDMNGLFVQRSSVRLFELAFDPNTADYASTDVTKLVPEVCNAGIVAMDVQRQPDTRIHCVLDDGTVAVLVYDPLENVRCWITVETPGASGFVEDVVVMPGLFEDAVYYLVRRTINGQTVRNLERWAQEADCQGGTMSRLADCYATYQGSPVTTITGLDYLEGEDVVVWADGKDQGNRTVASGSISFLNPVSNAVIGLGYEARYLSSKLAYAAGLGTALTQPKRVAQLGLILSNTHAQGIKYGPSFAYLKPLPRVERGKTVDPDYIWTHYDQPSFEFPGEYDTDSRIALVATAPRCATVLAAIVGLETNDKG